MIWQYLENDEDEDIEGDNYLDSESSEWSPYDVPEDYDSDEYDDEDEEN